MSSRENEYGKIPVGRKGGKEGSVVIMGGMGGMVGMVGKDYRSMGVQECRNGNMGHEGTG